MRVINRDNESVVINFEAIKCRLLDLCSPEERSALDIDLVVIKTIPGIEDNITTSRLDELSAMICASLQSSHYMYDTLAGKILVSNLHKNVRRIVGSESPASFSTKLAYIADCHPGLLNRHIVGFVAAYAKELDAMLDYGCDDGISYFSFRTLEKAYLLRANDDVIEAPQDLFMRVAVALYTPRPDDAARPLADVLADIRTVYGQLSRGWYTHATPTLFNAGMKHEQMSSCYLLGMEDSLHGIYKTLGDCAQISKWAGGIGIHVSNIRAKGSTIKSTHGKSDGIVPMLKVFNETARYCNQSGRRKGSIAVYLEPWHADVMEFIELRRQTGAETVRARDLFLALWIPDEFMRRMTEDREWYLMSPDECPGLQDACGDDFVRLYEYYIAKGNYVKKMSARSLWLGVLQSQVETGTPYILFKDTINAKCNQNNIGTIKSSNLCSEIIQYSDSDTYAVCNLASIAVNKFYDVATKKYDFESLHTAAQQVTRNLNRIIDINFYPTPETRASNMRLRPIGIGIQGLSDLYNQAQVVYGSPEALSWDAQIMETIYHGALESSIALAVTHGSYAAFPGSMFSRGILQHDLYESRQSGLWNWEDLRTQIREHGCRNSMLTALMPTASTSQILGNCECFEPLQSHAFKRTTLAGEFLVVNKYLMQDLIKLGLWNENMRNELLLKNGSVADISKIPSNLQQIYRTVWEIPQKSIVDHAAARAAYVDQSQSMNLFFAVPNYQKLNSALVYGWKSGLKTGCYYMRSKPANEAIKVTSVNRNSDSEECTVCSA